MEDYQYKFVEGMLRRYPFIDHEIERAKYEASQRRKISVDENVGGGRAQNKDSRGIEDTIINIDENDTVNRLIMNKHSIADALVMADDIVNLIINELYFKQHSVKTLDSLSIDTGDSKRTLVRKREAFFKQLYRNLYAV